MKNCLRLAVAALFALMASPHARAGLIIEVQDATINPGGMGFIDVFIRSDGRDLLDAVNYQFRINPVGSPLSSLVYEDPQDTSEEFDPSYVFFGDNLGLLPIVNSSTDLEGSDLTLLGSGVVLDTTDRLLTRLDLQHVLGPGQTPFDAGGEQFTVSLFVNPSPSDNLSFFLDPDGNPLSFSSSPGTVTVNQIPEPQPLLIWSVMMILLGGVTQIRKIGLSRRTFGIVRVVEFPETV